MRTCLIRRWEGFLDFLWRVVPVNVSGWDFRGWRIWAGARVIRDIRLGVWRLGGSRRSLWVRGAGWRVRRRGGRTGTWEEGGPPLRPLARRAHLRLLAVRVCADGAHDGLVRLGGHARHLIEQGSHGAVDPTGALGVGPADEGLQYPDPVADLALLEAEELCFRYGSRDLPVQVTAVHAVMLRPEVPIIPFTGVNRGRKDQWPVDAEYGDRGGLVELDVEGDVLIVDAVD